MSWGVLDILSAPEWSEFTERFSKRYGFSYYKKPRFLVDENVGEKAVQFLKEMNCNVKGVWAEGLCGKSDEQIVRLARKEKRIILTHDTDFIDERLYPLKLCHGVVVLPHASQSHSALEPLFTDFIHFIKPGAGFVHQAKMRISENGIWDITYLGFEGRKIQKIIQLRKDGVTTLVLKHEIKK